MKILIFGATGLIGAAVTRLAVAQGHTVEAVVRSPSSAGRALALGAIPLHGDMGDPASWAQAARACDTIIQLAADMTGDMEAAEARWVDGLIELQAARRLAARILYTGGCWLFPDQTASPHAPPITEATPVDPLPAFAHMVEHRQRLLDAGLRTVTVHPGMVWREDAGVWGDVCEAISSDAPIEVVGSAETVWPMVHADDLAHLYLAAAAHPTPPTDLFGVAESGVRVIDLIDRAAASMGRPARLQVLSVDQAVARHGAWIAGQARSQRISGDLAREALGWSPLHRILP